MSEIGKPVPADKAPITSQVMWELASQDYTRAEIMAKATKDDPAAEPRHIVQREREVRIRRAICNALDFLITNESDIDAVIARRKGRSP